MLLEIEIRSDDAPNDIYELRNFLRENGEDIQLQIKEQPPQQGQMALGLIEPILGGIVEVAVKYTLEEFYPKILKPRIKEWLAKWKSAHGGKDLQVLSTLKDDTSRVHFLEDSNGHSEIYRNVKYAIDVQKTKAMLIGVSEFDNSFTSIPPVKGNMEDFYQLLTDKLHVGLPHENVGVALNKTNTEIEEMLLQYSSMPDIDTLMIYFTGHGHRTDLKKLYLIARNSKRINDFILGGIDFDFISNVVLRNSTAKQKIVVLDACHSGIATQGEEDLAKNIEVKGTYILASSPGDEVSYFEKSARNTYFTGVLLDGLRKGFENVNEMIALQDLYEYSKTQLADKNFPHPIYKNQLNIPPANFFVARNPLFSVEKLKQKPAKLYQQGKLDEALYEYRLLLQRFPDDVELRRKTEECETNILFGRLVHDGDEQFFTHRNYALAADRYRKALTIKEDIQVLNKLIKCEEYTESNGSVKVYTQPITVTKEKAVNTHLYQQRKKLTSDLENEENENLNLNPKPPPVTDKRIGIFLAITWLLTYVIAFSIVAYADWSPLEIFSSVSVIALFVAAIIVLARQKSLSNTEVLMYIYGGALSLLTWVGHLIKEKNYLLGISLFLSFNVWLGKWIYKRLGVFRLADAILSSIAILFLFFLFFNLLAEVLYKKSYSDKDEAVIIGGSLGLVLGGTAVILIWVKWFKAKKSSKLQPRNFQ